MEREFLGLLLQDHKSFLKVYAEGNIFIDFDCNTIFETMISLEDKDIEITPESIEATNDGFFKDQILELMMIADKKDMFILRFDKLLTNYYHNKIQRAVNNYTKHESCMDFLNSIEVSMTTEKKEMSDFSTIKDMHIEYMELEQRENTKTGFKYIDKYIGITKSQLVIIGARPKTGKTSFMIDLNSRAINNGQKIGVFSMEINKARYDSKFLANRLDLDSNMLYYKSFTKNIEMQVANELDNTKDMKMYIMDKRVDLNYLIKKIRYLKAKYDIDQIYIDHLHFIKYYGKDNRIEQLSKIVNTLAELKNELNITIFLLAQLNRDSEQNPRSPRMSDLKGSGDIEQAADVIILMHKKEVTNKTRSYVDFGIISRYGGNGVMHTTFEQDVSRFKEIDNRLGEL